MSQQGYYRFPDVRNDIVIFVSEDDLWSVPLLGGLARRLTANLASVASPKISPDGQWIAYSALEEGYREIYLMPSQSGIQKRLTYLGAWSTPIGWSEDSQYIYFCSNFESPFFNDNSIYQVSLTGGEPKLIPVGHANQMSCASIGKDTIKSDAIKNLKPCVIGRYTRDTARWKRYRGGRTGEIWLDRQGNGEFVKLLSLSANMADPLWIGTRIYFVSDHEGIGNIYSCNLEGQDIQRHTHHEEFYVRNASSDGKTIIYHSAADLYRLEIETNISHKIEINYASCHTQTNRKFIRAAQYIQGYDISSHGTHTAMVSRGKIVSFPHWSGPVVQWGQRDGVRYRLPTWLYDSKTLIVISDELDGEDRILIIDTEKSTTKLLKNIPLGIVRGIFPSPKDMNIIITNHKNQMILVDCKKQTSKILETSLYSRIEKVSWSFDARWLTYDFTINHDVSIIKIFDLVNNTSYPITSPVASDFSPVFSNDGKYIFFIGHRIFYPVYDSIRFDLGFIKSSKLYAIILQKETISPFVPRTKSPAGEEKPKEDKKKTNNKKNNKKEKKVTLSDSKIENKENNNISIIPADNAPSNNVSSGNEIANQHEKEKESKTSPKSSKTDEKIITIDLEGIEKRIIVFPIEAGIYSHLETYQNKVFYLEHPRPCTQPDQNSWADREPKPQEILKVYDLEKLSEDTLAKNVTNYAISIKGSTMLVRQGNQLFAYKSGDKNKEKAACNRYTSEDGEIDLNRISLSVIVKKEWEQMYRQAWLLQREHFWNENMSGVDWGLVYQRYWPLLNRVGSRGEFSDLIWEMQGELGTSHCYEYGGDYRPGPRYPLGSLGCSYRLAEDENSYIIEKILYGDSCNEEERSPLLAPGVCIEENDRLIEIAGIPVNKETHPREVLLALADREIPLTIQKSKEKTPQTIVVKTLKTEDNLRYRAWIEHNRNYTHEKSQGRLGYLHIPNMGVSGFAEFYRYYTQESHYEGLVIDVRYNAGGHVSQLLLETLLRKPIAYRKPRWTSEPYTYPYNAFEGPMAALTNQDAGSDGDIFSHAFKLFKLGKLIGKRTWGGVIGINGQYSLVDGTVTTQPEYCCWFKDVGWAIENYGTDPDIDIDILPKDYLVGIDTQLDTAISFLLQELQNCPSCRPKLGNPPDRSLPKLPKL